MKETFRYFDTRQGGESRFSARSVGLHMFSSSTASRSPFSRGEGKVVGWLSFVRRQKVVGSFLCLPLWGRCPPSKSARSVTDELRASSANGIQTTFRYADTRQGGESRLSARVVDLHMLSSSTAIAVPLLQRRRQSGENGYLVSTFISLCINAFCYFTIDLTKVKIRRNILCQYKS